MFFSLNIIKLYFTIMSNDNFLQRCYSVIRSSSLINRTKIWFFISMSLLAFLLLAMSLTEVVKTVTKHSNSGFISSSSEYAKNISSKYDEKSLNFTVQSGDTISSILSGSGVEDSDVTSIISSLKQKYNPAKISIGQNIALFFDYYKDEDDKNIRYLSALKLSISPEKSIEIYRNADFGFDAKEINVPLVKYMVNATGEITNSLFGTASSLGIPNQVIAEIVSAFSYDVDFQRDIHEGDKLSVVYERYYDNNGNYARDGKPIYMSLNIGGEELRLYYYDNGASGDYYNDRGESVKKELLKTPINAARISSGFGMRKHPVLGYNKMHKGVDFAAPIGTPIYAAGDGVIEESGRKGTYGNYVRVKHPNSYSTAYAHCSKIAKGVRPGTRVKQGQIVAYVGATGRSTAPHLHFEVLKDGKHINPLNVKFASNIKLFGTDMKKFKQMVSRLSDKVISLPNNSEIASEFVTKNYN